MGFLDQKKIVYLFVKMYVVLLMNNVHFLLLLGYNQFIEFCVFILIFYFEYTVKLKDVLSNYSFLCVCNCNHTNKCLLEHKYKVK